MSRLLDDATKRNLWGATASNAANVQEPQRSDLWYADFKNAVAGVAAAFGQGTVTAILPQAAQSVSLPENKVKVEPFRRDSIPYNMPSWDEPLEQVRMIFLMDTSTQGVSNTLNFLQLWLELCRAGRGYRSSGYNTDQRGDAVLLLDQNYQSQYRFDCFVSFCRGNNDGASTTSLFSDLEAWQTLRLQQMWLAGLKISDLDYAQNNSLVKVETNFYVESIDWMSTP